MARIGYDADAPSRSPRAPSEVCGSRVNELNGNLAADSGGANAFVTAEGGRPGDDRQRATRLTAAVVDMLFRLRGGAEHVGRGLLLLVSDISRISVAVKGCVLTAIGPDDGYRTVQWTIRMREQIRQRCAFMTNPVLE